MIFVHSWLISKRSSATLQLRSCGQFKLFVNWLSTGCHQVLLLCDGGATSSST
jgi:hypothetical protein